MNVIIITEAAQAYLAELLEKRSAPGIGIRISTIQPGTQYAETYIAYCKPGEEKVEDTAIALKNFIAWIDVVSELFLGGAVADHAIDHMGGQLTIKAPNVKAPIANEDNPITERINYYPQTEINPGLTNHGGQVNLVNVVEDNITVSRFGGGCQGCRMINVTLRDDVEKTLIECIPELRGVRDVTDHSNKEDAYY